MDNLFGSVYSSSQAICLEISLRRVFLINLTIDIEEDIIIRWKHCGMAIDAVSLSPIVKLLDENIAAWLSMLYHLVLLLNY